MKVMLVKDRNVLNTRFLTDFANSLVDLGYEVTVACDSINKAGSGEVLDDRVNFVNLSDKTKNPLCNLYLRIRSKFPLASFRYAELIKKESPDVIICYFLKDLFNVGFLVKKLAPVILMGHNYPPETFNKVYKKNCVSRSLYARLIGKVDAFQVLMPEFIDTIDPYFNIKKVTVIPNAVRQFVADEQVDLSVIKKKIVYVARFSKEGKRQHLLIEAFARVAHKNPDWVIELWGLKKGEKYINELQSLINSNQLQNKVFIMGYTRNIYEKYRGADINAFPSKREGFGLGLAEGMAVGLPSIGFKNTPAVDGLIVDGHNGFLVNNLDEFSTKLDLLMSDQNLRIRLGANAVNDMKRFSPETVIQKWDRLIKDVVKNNN